MKFFKNMFKTLPKEDRSLEQIQEVVQNHDRSKMTLTEWFIYQEARIKELKK